MTEDHNPLYPILNSKGCEEKVHVNTILGFMSQMSYKQDILFYIGCYFSQIAMHSIQPPVFVSDAGNTTKSNPADKKSKKERKKIILAQS